MGPEIDSLYGSLWEIYEKETKYNELLDIDPMLYTKLKEFIANLDKHEKNKLLSIAKDIENIRKVKLARYAIYKKSISKALPKEESDLFDELVKILSRSYFDDLEIKDKEAEIKKTSKIKIRAKQDLDAEILLPSGATAGPFKTNTIIELDDSQDADYLVRSGLCEYI